MRASAGSGATPHVRSLQALILEADRDLPRSLSAVWQRQEELKEVVRGVKAWSALAQALWAVCRRMLVPRPARSFAAVCSELLFAACDPPLIAARSVCAVV